MNKFESLMLLKLSEIHKTLLDMKEQEKQYWETWKISKLREKI